MKLGTVSELKNWYQSVKKFEMKRILKSSAYSFTIMLLSLYAMRLTHNSPIYPFLFFIEVLPFIIGMGVSIVNTFDLYELFNEPKTFKYKIENFEIKELSETHFYTNENIKEMINFLASVSQLMNNAAIKFLTIDTIEEIEKKLIYNQTITHEYGKFLPKHISDILSKNNIFINKVIKKTLKNVIDYKLLDNSVFKELLEKTSVKDKLKQLKTSENNSQRLNEHSLEKLKQLDDKVNMALNQFRNQEQTFNPSKVQTQKQIKSLAL